MFFYRNSQEVWEHSLDKTGLAIFSTDHKYRYVLTRRWDLLKPCVAFIGLNPSTADADKNDATIRKCIKYAKDWGYGGLIMLNAFGYRSTDWTALKGHKDPWGKANGKYLTTIKNHCDKIIAAWGNHLLDIDPTDGYTAEYIVSELGNKLYFLKMTKQGQPSHPLYLKGDLKPRPWIEKELK